MPALQLPRRSRGDTGDEPFCAPPGRLQGVQGRPEPAYRVDVTADQLAIDDLRQVLWRDLNSDTFNFHRLSVADAMSARQYQKAEAYDGYLYVILHGIHYQKGEHAFATHDVDFFVGANYLVTVHDGGSDDVDALGDLLDHGGVDPGRGGGVEANRFAR